MIAVRKNYWYLQSLMFSGMVIIVSHSFAYSAPQNPELPRPSASPPDWDYRYDLFAALLEYQGLEPIWQPAAGRGRVQWDRWIADPAETVVILTGDLRRVSNARATMKFLRSGGSMLIASDSSVLVRGFFETRSGPVVTRSVSASYKGYADCLELREFDSSSRLFEGVDSVVTNCCGWISSFHSPSRDFDWKVRLRLPNGIQTRGASGMPLMMETTVHGQLRDGHLILLADESLPTNSMLWHGDNAQFVMNLSRSLTAGDRTKFVFLHNGKPVLSRISELLVQEAISRAADPSEIPPEAIHDLPLDTLLKITNAVITEVEDSGVLNELMVDRPKHLSSRFFRRANLLAAAVIAMFFFLMRSWFTAAPRLPWSPSGDRRAETDTGDRPPSDYKRAASGLTRRLCRDLTGSDDPQTWVTELSPGGGVYTRLCAQSDNSHGTAAAIGQISRQIATDPLGRVSRREFVKIGNSVQLLRQLHAAGGVSQSALQTVDRG